MNPIPTGDESPASFYDLCLQQSGKPYVTAKVHRDSEALSAAAQMKFAREFFGIPNRRATWSRKRYLKHIRRQRIHSARARASLDPIVTVAPPCPRCDGNGWYAARRSFDQPEQEQCELCGVSGEAAPVHQVCGE